MTNKTKIAIATVVAVAIAIIYASFDPTGVESRWFPKCTFHLLTGLKCPACGSQRALHAILHGHMAEALRYNLFIVVSVPMLAATAIMYFATGTRTDAWVRRTVLSEKGLWVFIALFTVWWVVRNIWDL